MRKKDIASILIGALNSVLLLLGSSGMAHAAIAAAPKAGTARLWKVQTPANKAQPSTTYYFLALTHLGLPLEYDEYLDRVVLPAYRSADSLYYEGAGSSAAEIAADTLPPCDSAVLDDKGRARLADIRAVVTQAGIEFRQLLQEHSERAGRQDGVSRDMIAKLQRGHVAQLDEYQLLDYYLYVSDMKLALGAAAPAQPQPQPAAQDTGLQPEVVQRLLAEKHTLAIHDIDGPYGARRAYCNSGKDRLALIDSFLHREHSSSASLIARIPELESNFRRLLLERRTDRQDPHDPLAILDQTLVCQRNEEWVRKITAIQDGRVHFFALGIKHLFDIQHASAKCEGILNKLKEKNIEPVLMQ